MSASRRYSLAGTAIGGLAGGMLGGFTPIHIRQGKRETPSHYQQRKNKIRSKRIVFGGILGGMLGSSVGSAAGAIKDDQQAWKAYKEYSSRRSREWDDWFKAWDDASRGFGTAASSARLHPEAQALKSALSNVRTKAEAQKIFRTSALRNHPDKGGSMSAMQGINNFWSDFKNSTQFSKLAILFGNMHTARSVS